MLCTLLDQAWPCLSLEELCTKFCEEVDRKTIFFKLNIARDVPAPVCFAEQGLHRFGVSGQHVCTSCKHVAVTNQFINLKLNDLGFLNRLKAEPFCVLLRVP